MSLYMLNTTAVINQLEVRMKIDRGKSEGEREREKFIGRQSMFINISFTSLFSFLNLKFILIA